jgi:hypothetical protein
LEGGSIALLTPRARLRVDRRTGMTDARSRKLAVVYKPHVILNGDHVGRVCRVEFRDRDSGIPNLVVYIVPKWGIGAIRRGRDYAPGKGQTLRHNRI